jgi:hypothetical protein
MAITNPVVNKVFNDLDAYRDFCRFEGDGRVFDEKALYNNRDYNWQAYLKFQNKKAYQDRNKKYNNKQR